MLKIVRNRLILLNSYILGASALGSLCFYMIRRLFYVDEQQDVSSSSFNFRNSSVHTNRSIDFFADFFHIEKPRLVLNDYLSLLKLAHSKNVKSKQMGVRAIADLGQLHKYKLEQICQMSDFSVLAALILSGVSLKAYLKLKFPLTDSGSLKEQLRKMLESLNLHTNDVRLHYYTNLALNKLPDVKSTDLEAFSGGFYDQEDHWFQQNFSDFPDYTRLLLYCKALEAQSTDRHQCDRIVAWHGIDLLMRMWHYAENLHKDDKRLKISVLKILANISLHNRLKRYIFQTGWFPILEECLKNKQLEYFLLSNKILQNLASEFDEEPKFDDGVYIISGGEWEKKTPVLDVVFIHGLRGGLFHTWRQRDARFYPELIRQQADALCKFRTSCWPKDWLPNDLDRPVRVLAVDYESFLSDWIPKCPDVKIRHRLENRSKEILNKLKKAGVGERPVVWVAHSMGGLAVKRMLNLINEPSQANDQTSFQSFKSVLSNTRGCVFYATPHYGTPVASRTVEGLYRYLMLPSVEVSELAENSPYLLDLHTQFRRLVENRELKIVNFCETLKTTVPRVKLNILLVPKWSAFGYAGPAVFGKKGGGAKFLSADHVTDHGGHVISHGPMGMDPHHQHQHGNFGRFYEINSNHFNICKPETRISLNYVILVEFIDEILRDLSRDRRFFIKFSTLAQ